MAVPPSATAREPRIFVKEVYRSFIESSVHFPLTPPSAISVAR
jgi:hypothetical protein